MDLDRLFCRIGAATIQGVNGRSVHWVPYEVYMCVPGLHVGLAQRKHAQKNDQNLEGNFQFFFQIPNITIFERFLKVRFEILGLEFERFLKVWFEFFSGI